MKTKSKPVEIPLIVKWNHVVLQILKPADINGVLLPESYKSDDTIQHALIIAVGPCVCEQNPEFVVGAHVLLKMPGCIRFRFCGNHLILAFDSAIMGVVEEKTTR